MNVARAHALVVVAFAREILSADIAGDEDRETMLWALLAEVLDAISSAAGDVS